MPDGRHKRAEKLAGRGQLLMVVGVFPLLLAGGILKLFFPEQPGDGIPPALMPGLLTTWLLCGVGCGLCLWAWVIAPDLTRDLELAQPKRSDGTYFGPTVRVLGCLTLCLISVGMIALLFATDEPTPLGTRAGAAYVVVCLTAFMVYLSFFYDTRRHLATTTYFNLLTPLFGFPLILLTWPMLIWLNLRSASPNRPDN